MNNSKINIDKIRPLWQVNNDTLLMKTGSYAYIYEMSLKEIFLMDEFDYDQAINEFTRMFNLLPDYIVVHKMDVFFNKKYKGTSSEEDNNILKKEFFQKYFEKKYVDHKCYLIIAKTDSRFIKKTSLNSLLFKKNTLPKELISEEDYSEFIKSISRVEQVLNDTPFFKLRKLSIEESIDLMSKYENLDFSDNKYSSNIFQDKNNTKIGNKNLSVVALNSLECLPNNYSSVFVDPKFRNDNSSIPFSAFFPIGLGLDFDHIVNQIYIKIPKQIIKDELKKIDLLNTTFQKSDASNILNIEDSNAFSTEMEKGNIPLYYHCNVMVYDVNKEDLDIKTNSIYSAFNKIKITPNTGINEALPLFWSCYPGNAADIGFIDQTFLLLANEASALNIYETNSKSNISPTGVYFNNRINLTPLFIDISDLPKELGFTNNRNKLIIGPSGSGKSFLTNHLTNSYLEMNSHMVIVDIGGSYKRLCELKKGKYIEYDYDNPLSFNPFYISDNDNIDNIERYETLVTLIFTLWKENPTAANKDENTIIRAALVQYYKWIIETNNEKCFNTYYEFMTEVFFINLKDNDVDKFNLINVSSFKNVLGMFYKGGQYDYLLNSNTDLDLFNEKFIVFELDNIKDNSILFPVVSLMIMDVFITKMRYLKNTRKIIVIEEAWKPIAQGMADFIKYLFKTIRKHFGEAWIVTQELNDIIGNEIIKDTIIKNCGAKILLDMREYRDQFKDVQELLSLSNKTANLVLSINKNKIEAERYKEVFIGLGNEGQVYALSLSKLEYATYTSEKDEIEQIYKLKGESGSLELALRNYSETLN